MSPAERDAAARESAQTVFDRPLVLEAGAGTGKTSSLVARITAWCVGPGWERALSRRLEKEKSTPARGETELFEVVAVDVLSRVAAITFTEAAAAEMAERTGEAFSALARGDLIPGLLEAALPEERDLRTQRARVLLAELDHLVVRTIHAWCRGLLARHPLESGLHPNFSVDADLRLQAEVVREVVEETLRAAYASEDSPLLELAVAGHGALEVEATLASLVAEGVLPEQLRESPFAPDRVEKHLAGLRDTLGALRDCDAGRLIDVPARASRTHAALGALELSEAWLASFKADGVDSLEALCQEVADGWQGAALARLVEWSKGKLNGAESDALGGDAAEFAERAASLLPFIRALMQLSPRRLEAARRALLPMLESVYAKLRARGIASFASLLSGARNLLASNPDVARRVRSELDQLLVDEFQDTDSLQCSIVRQLALAGPQAERPGLFLVGDPKQSIYGWRSADLAAYDGFVREVEAAGGERHSLTLNFRSVPAILDEVERAMAPVMLRQEGLQPRFERLQASPRLRADAGFRRGDRAPVEYWAIRRPDASEAGDAGAAPQLKSSEATRIEAEALAQDLLDLHDNEGVAWRDMAVLFRGMGDLEEYLAAMRGCGVPYAVERDRNYYRRREVIDAAALLRCVLDPNDHLALVTTLRSPAVGVPDAALIPLWSQAFPSLAAELYGTGSPALSKLDEIARQVARELHAAPRDGAIPGLDRIQGWEVSLSAFLETLGALRESFECEAADLFVERLRTLSLLEVSEAARYLGVFRAANLERFFRELQRGWVAGSDPQSVLRRLRGDIARGRDEAEQRPVGEAEDAVPVMTIHKAKGLDFEHVYLAQLHKRSRGNELPATAVAECEGVFEYRFFAQSSLGFDRVRQAAQRVEAAERVRTLYVAMTRAKRRLVLMGSWQACGEPVPYERAASHCELLAARIWGESGDVAPPLDLAALMQSCVEAGQSQRDAAGIRWVFPTLASERASRPRQSGSALEGSALASSDTIARERLQIATLRRSATARMRHAFGGPASFDAHARLERAAGEPATPVRASAERPAASSRAVSIAAGVVIHRVLEELDLSADRVAELARQRLRLPDLMSECEGLSETGQRRAVLERAGALLDRFAAGPLSERLWQVAPHVVARELEVWLPGCQDSHDEAIAPPPLRYIAGAVDLVYRDPSDGSWVVADYKTDRVAANARAGRSPRVGSELEGQSGARRSAEAAEAGEAAQPRRSDGSGQSGQPEQSGQPGESAASSHGDALSAHEVAGSLDERAAVYTSQGKIYTQAVQQALSLEQEPRFELWFLDADIVVAPGSESR